MAFNLPSFERMLAFAEKRKQGIADMIEKYSAGLDGPADGVLLNSSQAIEPSVVLLTGTTGSLGSSLLSYLLNKPAVQRVYAFNRPSTNHSIEERHLSAFKDKDLALNVLQSSKLVYVVADASLDNCGLSPVLYKEIQNSVTLIIHNAWTLNFSSDISFFDDNVRATRNLIDLGLAGAHKENLRFLFVSSNSSGMSWDNSTGLFPEEVHLDPSVAIGTGYGEAKYAAERIVAKSGLHSTSLRVGQIAGSKGGFRSTTDWLMLMLKSVVSLRAVPIAPGVFSALREEEVAHTIMDVAFTKEVLPPALNLTNPRGTPVIHVISCVRRAIIRHMERPCKEDDIPIIPFKDWVVMVEERAKTASQDDLINIPAIRLLKFLRMLVWRDQLLSSEADQQEEKEALGVPNFSTTKAQRISPTMAKMQSIRPDEVDAWLRHMMSKVPVSENPHTNRARL